MAAMFGTAEAIVFLVLLCLVTIWAVFWIIRLAVRYGVGDALEIQRQRETARRAQSPAASGGPPQ